eukprot:8281316-Ditylum_brightwellii.AAC.1
MAIAKGHMACICKNVRLTTSNKGNNATDPAATPEIDPDLHLPQQPIKTHEVYVILKLAEEFDHILYTDLTRKCPVTSQASNKYVLIAYDYDSNSIIAVPVPSQSDSSLKKAIMHVYTYLTDR